MSDTPVPGRREFSRVVVHLRTELIVAGTVHRDGTMENLSLSGGFFRSGNAPVEGQRCEVRLHLDGTAVAVRVTGRILRSGPAGAAIEFTEIVGLDSLEHLRNLILFNAPDPAQVEREFHSHLGLHRD